MKEVKGQLQLKIDKDTQDWLEEVIESYLTLFPLFIL
jgi:hypothetical protein